MFSFLLILLQYRQFSVWLQRFLLIYLDGLLVLELIEALTRQLDKFLFCLRPKISLVSIIGRVPFVRSNSSQFCLTISAMVFFLGLCVVMQ